MRIGFLTMEQYENRELNRVGSSRIRGRWVMKYCPEIIPFKNGEHFDAIIYQKAYWLEHMKTFQGIKIFDLCDADWLEGRPITEIAQYVDAFTVSTQALKDFLSQLVDIPVVLIPDRIDPEEHPAPKDGHFGKLRSAVWFGYSQNFPVLDQCVEILRSKNIQLVVIADRRYFEADVNLTYEYKTLHEELVKHDVVLAPTYPDSYKHIFKSNNKTLTSWALKMPVVWEVPDLDKYMQAEARNQEANEKYNLVMKEYHSKLSGPEYIKLINELAAKK